MVASCQTCRFAQFFRGTGAMGYCRLKPPVPLRIDSDVSTEWPRVAYDDWCGQHEPAKPGRGASVETLASMLEPFLAVAEAMDASLTASAVVFDFPGQDGRELILSGTDFRNLAAAWAAVRGA